MCVCVCVSSIQIKKIKHTNYSKGVSIRSKGSLQDTVGLRESIPRRTNTEGV